MGLFSKKPGGTFFGNILRGAVSVAQSVGGVNLGMGAGQNKIEAGQRYTNKQITENPGLYITAGESATNGEIDVNSSLSKGFYGFVPPPLPKPIVSGNTLLDNIQTIKQGIAGTGQTLVNANKISEMMRWAIPAGVGALLLIVFGVFKTRRR